MKAFIRGSNQAVDLTQRNFLAQGGQGSIYVRGDTAFKLFHDPANMIPVGKIAELGALTDPRIIRPQEVLVDARGTPVGYTSRYAKDSVALCQIFPRSFREREGVTHEAVQGLVRKLQEGVAHVHARGILVVDLNEMNFLVGAGWDEIYFIDVDSYQTPHYAAPALMESVRDWSVEDSRWTEKSDWFSFGVVTFQMFTGIHPFKGGYAGPRDEFRRKLPTDADDDAFAVTRRRMRANVSVFHPDVKCPASAYPITAIPPPLRAWYEAVFARGERGAPPVDFKVVAVLAPAPRVVSGSTRLDVAEIGSYPDTVRRLWSDGTRLVVATDRGTWLDKVQVSPSPAAACGFSPRAGRAVVVLGGANPPEIYNATDRAPVPFTLAAQEVSSSGGRIYVRGSDQVHEVVLTDAGAQVVASAIAAVNVLPHATRLYPGVVVQNMLGSVFASLLVRAGAAVQVRIPELDPYKIVEAGYDGGVLMVVGAKGGQYDRLVLRFEGDAYDLRRVENVALTGLNFVTLDSGVCVCLNEEEKLEVFSRRRGATEIRYVEDPAVGGDVVLGKMGGTLVAARGSRVYSLKMK